MSSKWWVLGMMMLGCAGTPAETVPTAPVEAPAPAPVVAAPPPAVDAPAPVEAPAAGGLAVVVDAHRQLGEGPAASGAAATVVATPKINRVDLVIDQIVSYCAPAPSFTATTKPDVLEVTLVRPAEVSRCFGTHHVEAHVDLPGRHGLQRVVVLGHDGKVLAEAPIASAH